MADQMTIEDFQKLEIKVGKVKSVERVENTDKLLKFIFDIGNGEERQILAGVAEFYTDLDSLIGKEMPLLLNLKPRKLRGLESQGMMLAIDANGSIALLHPNLEVEPGSTVR